MYVGIIKTPPHRNHMGWIPGSHLYFPVVDGLRPSLLPLPQTAPPHPTPSSGLPLHCSAVRLFAPSCPPFVTVSHLFPRLTRIFTLSSTSSLPSTVQFFFFFLQDCIRIRPLQLHLLKCTENFRGALLRHLSTHMHACRHTPIQCVISQMCFVRFVGCFFVVVVVVFLVQYRKLNWSRQKGKQVNKSRYTNKHLGPVSGALRLTAPGRHQPLYEADSSLTSEKNADWLLLDLRAHWLPAGCFFFFSFFFLFFFSQRCQLTPRWAAPVLLTVLQQQDKTRQPGLVFFF